MTQHTRGPWFVRPPQSNFQKGKYTINPALSYAPNMADHEKLIAVVGSSKFKTTEVQANANLIAAAPIMAESLQWVVDRQDVPEVVKNYCRMILAKAEGR